MKKYHEIKTLQFNREKLEIEIDDQNHEFKLVDISEKLANASDIERNKYEISPSGYGIHWPLIDEDLSIDGLLGKNMRPKGQKKLLKYKNWRLG
ncbi:DUF2442 domain-containing protein [candidate division KSB1 bacterium]|nr:DUF2442 domain-containing protein [candidate division KSB1 bacterium]